MHDDDDDGDEHALDDNEHDNDEEHDSEHDDEYEAKLSSALLTRDKLSPNAVNDLQQTRSRYEMARFDLVDSLNRLDGKKKIALTQASCCLYDTYIKCNELLLKQQSNAIESINRTQHDAVEAATTMTRNASLWQFVRARLEGELAGAMPPPGAPPGALSPVQPRWHPGMPVYTANITTEILSFGSRHATFEDLRHARDDGGKLLLMMMMTIVMMMMVKINMIVNMLWCAMSSENCDISWS